ncbi:MAG: putative toxin-antitoxin system toxin component, PIN family [Trueperaceae bacterium]
MRRQVVIDTNVLVSGLLTHDPLSPLTIILDGMLTGRIRFLLSLRLMQEYREVLLRPRVQRRHGLTGAEIDELLTEIAVVAAWREPSATAGEANELRADAAAPDPGDDHLWELLRLADDAILVTGDALLVERPPDFASVMTPRAFVALHLHSETEMP